MENVKEEVLKWTREISEYRTPSWESLPQIPLYLDQVVSFLEAQLKSLLQDENEKTITPSMINNYVKKKVIPAPEKKKYDVHHLARLLAIYTSKQILPISQISKFLNHFLVEEKTQEVLKEYGQKQDQALHNVAQRLEEELESCPEGELEELLRGLVLEFVVQANSMRMAAECIIGALPEQNRHKEKKG